VPHEHRLVPDNQRYISSKTLLSVFAVLQGMSEGVTNPKLLGAFTCCGTGKSAGQAVQKTVITHVTQMLRIMRDF
jgi:hypothetical protein